MNDAIYGAVALNNVTVINNYRSPQGINYQNGSLYLDMGVMVGSGGVMMGSGGSQVQTESIKSQIPTDCVVRAFDYIDGSAHDWWEYEAKMLLNLGHDHLTLDANGNTRGTNTADIPIIASYGGLRATLLGNTRLTPSGRTTSGNQVMMTFNGANGMDHAVVLTGVSNNSGTVTLSYYDPQNKVSGVVTGTNYTSLYEVSKI